MLTPHLLHALASAIAIVLGGIGSGLGQGIACFGTLHAMERQVMVTSHVMRTMILGLALIESGMILALVITLMLLFASPATLTLGIGLGQLGMGLAIGLAAAAVSIASSFAVKAACLSIARQPFFAQKIIILMILSQSIISASAIFAFVVALLINMQLRATTTTIEGIKLLAAGLTFGIGSIGPSIGQAIFSQSSCTASGLKKESYGKLLTFSLLSQAFVQTPLIFSLIIAMIIAFKPVTAISSVFLAAITFFSPGFAVSVGSLGPAVAIGYAAAQSSRHIAMDPENYPSYIRTSLLGQAIIQSAAIYALLVALILLTIRVF